MPIVRRQLKPSDVYPEDIRYNSDTDTVQSLINDEWVDNPAADPRTQTTFPPRLTSDPPCDAAQSVVDAIKAQIDAILTAIDNAQTAFTIAGLILGLFTFGVFEIFIAIALAIAGAMLDAGTSALSAALTDPVYHTLVCILRCHMNSSGRIIPGELGAVEADVSDQIGGLAATILNSMLSLAGEGGINNLASLGTSTGDCSDCVGGTACPAAGQGYEFGDVTSDTTICAVTTQHIDSGLSGGVHVVRWGFFATSNPEGCFTGGQPTADGTDQDWYYRFVGEADSTVHGPVDHDTLLASIDGQCINLLQVNCADTFHAIFIWAVCS